MSHATHIGPTEHAGPDWELFDMTKLASKNSRWRKSVASLSPAGRLSLSFTAWGLIGSPEWVALYFDRNKQRIAVRAAHMSEQAALYCRKSPRSKVRMVSIRNFLNGFGIPYPKRSQVYDVEREGNLLVINLRQYVRERESN